MNWIEKLYELLFDYSRNQSYYWKLRPSGKIEWDVWWTDHTLEDEEVSMVIKSKEFWFIQWLVENDKIDHDHYWNYALVGEWENGSYFQLRAVETILMLLSIQDNPIEFLISILK